MHEGLCVVQDHKWKREYRVRPEPRDRTYFVWASKRNFEFYGLFLLTFFKMWVTLVKEFVFYF